MGLTVGSVLDDRYEIVRAINKGGMGAVYEAVDRRLAGSKCAVKELLEDFQGVETQAAALIREKLELEMQFLATLQHPGIPRIRDAFAKGESYYLVMDYIEGSNLYELLVAHKQKHGVPLPSGEVKEFALEILEILDYLHTLDPPVLHRDIKPGNIIRTPQGKLKLVDFGLARQMTHSRAFTSVGTMGYLPVEQASGSPDQRSDLYALGATMHALVSGQPPTPFRIKPVASVYPKVDPALAAVIDRVVDNDPENRYASAKAMRDALLGVAAVTEDKQQMTEQPATIVVPEDAVAAAKGDPPKARDSAPVPEGRSGVGLVIPKEKCPKCGNDMERRERSCATCGHVITLAERIYIPDFRAMKVFLSHNLTKNCLIGVAHLLVMRLLFYMQSQVPGVKTIDTVMYSVFWLFYGVAALSLLGFGGHLLKAVTTNPEAGAPEWPPPSLGLYKGYRLIQTAFIVFLPVISLLTVSYVLRWSLLLAGQNHLGPLWVFIFVCLGGITLAVLLRQMFVLPAEMCNLVTLGSPPPLFDSSTTIYRQITPSLGPYVTQITATAVTLLLWRLSSETLAVLAAPLKFALLPCLEFAIWSLFLYFLGTLYRQKMYLKPRES